MAKARRIRKPARRMMPDTIDTVADMQDAQDYLVDLCTRAFKLLDAMEADGGARLPYPDFVETKKALEEVAEV